MNISAINGYNGEKLWEVKNKDADFIKDFNGDKKDDFLLAESYYSEVEKQRLEILRKKKQMPKTRYLLSELKELSKSKSKNEKSYIAVPRPSEIKVGSSSSSQSRQTPLQYYIRVFPGDDIGKTIWKADSSDELIYT